MRSKIVQVKWITEHLKKINMSDREIEQLAVNENSMLTLTQYGVELVKEHLTTISEVSRVCKSDH